MDSAVLDAVAGDLAGALTGRPLGDVVQLDSHRFLLRFDEASYPRLHVGIHPRLSVAHLARGLKAPREATELATVLSRELAGRRLIRVGRPSRDRLLRMEFETGRTLILELMGKASDLLLLDGEERILRFARSHGGKFRKPRIGAVYRPPIVPPTAIVEGPSELSSDTLRRALGALDEEGSPDGRLMDRVPGFSLYLAREIAHRWREGEDPWRVYVELRERLDTGEGSRVYSPGPLDSLPESTPVDGRKLFAFVLSLRHAEGLTCTPADTLSEALSAVTDRILRHMSYHSLAQSLSSHLRQEARRMGDLREVLKKELEKARSEGAGARRRGELILASLATARKEGDRVRVTDHYDPDGGMVDIPVRPELSLKDNAERYFRSARKAERALAVIPSRLARVEERLPMILEAMASVDRVPGREELAALESGLQEAGLVKAFRLKTREDVAERPRYVQVRRYVSRDGFDILVGKSGAENDHVTFDLAAPHDLWLHAAGYPGAHVVVRNPRRLGSIPEATVKEAASIAAYYSKGKESTNLDVHVAWRRHVRKGRGMSPGMVMLKKHTTIRVRPALPGGRVN